MTNSNDKWTLNRRHLLKIALAAPAVLSTGAKSQEGKPNIIFVTIDDLNACISPLSPGQGVVTPNFERLTDWGANFTNAFANVPACSPSRTSLMLGMSASETGIYFNKQTWLDAETPPGARSVFGYFRTRGWKTYGTGKLFHLRKRHLDPDDWDGYWDVSNRVHNPHIEPIAKSAEGHLDFGPAANGSRADIARTDWAVKKIEQGELDAGGVMLGLGLFRPHLPMIVGRKWFDLYPRKVHLPPGYWPGSKDHLGNIPDQFDLPSRALDTIDPRVGNLLAENHELNAYLKAYYASTSFADEQIGRLMNAMQDRNLLENTYLMVTSDHGYQLGEKFDFSKFELREISLQVPLFFTGPGIPKSRLDQPVSLIDIYPTLCGLTGQPVPAQCSGVDLSADLRAGTSVARDRGVMSWYGDVVFNHLRQTEHSRSIRTPDWRLIDYGHEQFSLYDHNPASEGYDPYEWYNVAQARPDIVDSLDARMPALDKITPTGPTFR